MATPIPNGSASLKKSSRSENMVELIRRDIVRAALQPGEHLSQSHLAEQYSISKVPVREALKQLYAEGLLQYDRNRGYFVTRPSKAEAQQLYKMRRWIETELLQTARWPDAAEIAKMRSLFDVIAQPMTRENREAWLKSLSELRFQIYDLSTEKYLMREAIRLWALTDRFRALLPLDKAVTGELSLFDALVKHDRKALLTAHYNDRLRIEGMLADALDVLPAYWVEDKESPPTVS